MNNLLNLSLQVVAITWLDLAAKLDKYKKKVIKGLRLMRFKPYPLTRMVI